MSDECCFPESPDITAFLQDARRNLIIVRQSFGPESQRFRDMEATYREVAQKFDALPAFEALLQQVHTTNGEGLPSSK